MTETLLETQAKPITAQRFEASKNKFEAEAAILKTKKISPVFIQPSQSPNAAYSDPIKVTKKEPAPDFQGVKVVNSRGKFLTGIACHISLKSSQLVQFRSADKKVMQPKIC